LCGTSRNRFGGGVREAEVQGIKENGDSVECRADAECVQTSRTKTNIILKLMKIRLFLRKGARLVDLLVSLTLHIAGTVLLFRHQWVNAAIVFGMVSLWQIGCYGIKNFPETT
jgi:hypothetical protein